VLGTLLFLAISFTVGRRLVFRLIRWTNDYLVSSAAVITVILLLMSTMAMITHLIGVHTVLGAFVAGILVGVGPGAACTTRGVLGVGVPQVTATSDVAAARETWLHESGRRVQVITDGGMRVGGDIAKAFASGADAVMVGSIFAGTTEAAGGGYHWGMATPDPNLPRGTRIKVGRRGTLREVLLGPARVDDGTQNLVGALRSAMGVCGARDLREFQQTELVIAPAIQNEGKLFQQAQQVGMGT